MSEKPSQLSVKAQKRQAQGALRFALCALPLAFLWWRLIDHLRIEWSLNPQYAYGWAVPFLCLYLLWESARREARGEALCAWRFALRAWRLAPGASRFPLGALLFALGAFLYAPIRLIEEANPEWRLVSWALALTVVGLTLLALRIAQSARREAQGAGREAQDAQRLAPGAWRLALPAWRLPLRACRFALFPLCFFLVAVPWPTLVEQRLVQGLTQANAALTVECMGWFGVPAIQHGNVIEIGSGVLGIDEACSGIRSFQASLMISLFFGELYRLSVLRRIGLCVLGFGLSFLFNAIRTSVLVAVASSRGIDSVSQWHDPAGMIILLACFVSLWAISAILGQSAKREAQGAKREALPAWRFALGASRLAPCALALIAWIVLVEIGVEAWYRRSESRLPASAAWTVNVPRDALAFRELPIAEKARQILRYDEGLNVSWQDEAGLRWQMIFLRWLPGRTAVHLARNHTPEICLTAAGGKLETSSDLKLFPTHGLELPFRTYTFREQGRPVYVFYSLWDDRATVQQFETMSLTYANRLGPVLAGQRNRGQRSLELVLWGMADATEAEAALRRQLEKLVR